MKILYLLRVGLISFEFLILCICYLLITEVNTTTNNFIKELNLNAQVSDYLIFLPMALFVWITKELNELIFSEKENCKTLVNWPDYWQLKMHVYISIFYGVVFCVLSTVAWFSKNWFSSSFSLVAFSTSCIGLLIVAGSIYFAKMSVIEIINKE